MILLNPGPVNLHKDVKEALRNAPDMCHRSSIFENLLLETKNKILKLCNADNNKYDVIILSGSGTLGVQAMIDSFWIFHSESSVIVNGEYSCRMFYRLNYVTNENIKKIIQSKQFYLDKNSFNDIKNLQYENVFLVHHDTSTGVLNNIDKICKILKNNECRVFIDCTSSFGSEIIDFKKLDIDAISFSSNKCIESIPGCAIVVYKKELLEKGRQKLVDIDSLYSYSNLNLYKNNKIPFTPNTTSIYVLNKALELLINETINKRNIRYKKLNEYIRKEMINIGFKAVIPQKYNSSSLTSFYIPKNVDYKEYEKFMEKNDIIIYASNFKENIPLYKIAKNQFRIANMGQITENHINKFLHITKQYMGSKL